MIMDDGYFQIHRYSTYGSTRVVHVHTYYRTQVSTRVGTCDSCVHCIPVVKRIQKGLCQTYLQLYTVYLGGLPFKATHTITGYQTQFSPMLQKYVSCCLLWINAHAVIGNDCTGVWIDFKFFGAIFQYCCKWCCLGNLSKACSIKIGGKEILGG